MDAPRLTIENGDYKLSHNEPVLERLQEAMKDRDVMMRLLAVENGEIYEVSLDDGDEWGRGPDLETALRFALGAYYA